MNALLDLFSEIIGSLLDAIYHQKHSGKKIPWGRWLRLYGVGFSGFAILMYIYTYFAVDRDLSEAICCSSPFFIIGVALLCIEIIRNIIPWK